MPSSSPTSTASRKTPSKPSPSQTKENPVPVGGAWANSAAGKSGTEAIIGCLLRRRGKGPEMQRQGVRRGPDTPAIMRRGDRPRQQIVVRRRTPGIGALAGGHLFRCGGREKSSRLRLRAGREAARGQTLPTPQNGSSSL